MKSSLLQCSWKEIWINTFPLTTAVVEKKIWTFIISKFELVLYKKELLIFDFVFGLPAYLPVCLPASCLLLVCLSVCLSVCLPACLPFYLSFSMLIILSCTLLLFNSFCKYLGKLNTETRANSMQLFWTMRILFHIYLLWKI